MRGRDFRAEFVNGVYVMHCRRCGTREELSRDTLLHDVAAVHARWFHRRPVRLPPMGMVEKATKSCRERD